MKLLTKAIEKKLLENWGKENLKIDSTNIEKEKVVVKFFNPSGQATWWLHSMSNDGICFGVAQMFGRETREYGYFDINEIKASKCPPLGLSIERDMYYTPETFEELL
jgi:hypothetical protein